MQSQNAAELDWRDGTIPVSRQFDDPYFSIENGMAETAYVFLQGNGLPDRFRPEFHIAELGFGTGLNLLMALSLWRRSGQTGRLHFTTFEAFPMAQPETDEELTRPAVEGTLRALYAAHAVGIKRVVLTSSAVAVMQANQPKNRTFDETDWSDPDHPTNSAYGRSKLQAERAAWDMVAEHGINLTTINPVLVLGPPLDGNFGTSVAIVERLMSGKDPMLPKIGFPIVDVRDVAAAHVASLNNRETYGMRILANAGFLWFHQMAETLKEAHPDRKITTRIAPNFAIKLMARFDPQIRAVLPLLDVMPSVSNRRARRVLGLDFTPPRDAVRATAAYLVNTETA